KADEHVLALDAPVVGQGPFDAAASRPGGDHVAGLSGEGDPVPAPGRDRETRIRDRGVYLNKGRAAFDVDQGAIPGISQAACDHSVPVADLGASQNVWRDCLQRWAAKRVES